MNCIVYNETGKILRGVSCPSTQKYLQAKDGEFIMEGTANDVNQKIKNPGIDGKIIDKTPKEIKAEKPPEMPENRKPAYITNKQLQNILNRLSALEAKK